MRANNVLGIIQAQTYDHTLSDLTAIRTMASVPFGCRYRFIDFPLSNMVNAGITQVGIVTRDNYQSLMDHVGSGKPWDLARKNEGLFLLPPYNESSRVGGNSKVESLYSTLEFLKRSRQEYVVITDANAVYNFDFTELFDYHDEVGADITICYKNGPVPKVEDLEVFNMDENGRIIDLSISDGEDGEEGNYSFNIYVMRKTLLQTLIKGAIAKGSYDFSRDVIQSHIRDLKIFGYEIPGYAKMFDSLQSYYDVSMDLLKPENRLALLSNDAPISTKIHDNVPAIYGESCKTSNSLIADGCIIEGTVENSLLFRGVVVEKGAVVKNCILMQGTKVSAGATVNSIITDKNVSVSSGRTLSGDPTYPIYITKNVVV